MEADLLFCSKCTYTVSSFFLSAHKAWGPSQGKFADPWAGPMEADDKNASDINENSDTNV